MRTAFQYEPQKTVQLASPVLFSAQVTALQRDYFGAHGYFKINGPKDPKLVANVDGKVVPIDKIKVKKDAKSIKLTVGAGVANGIREKLQQEVDAETVQLLYKQAVKSISEFTNKEKALDWFLKKQVEVVDINHSMKIDNVPQSN